MPIRFSTEERALITAALGPKGAARLAELDDEHDQIAASATARHNELLELKTRLRDEQHAHQATCQDRERAIGEATKAHRASVHRAQITEAFIRSGVNPAALGDAVSRFMDSTEFNLRDDGSIKTSKLDSGEVYASLEVAATMFLEKRSPHFHLRWDSSKQRITADPNQGEVASQPRPEGGDPEKRPTTVAGLFHGAADELARVRRAHNESVVTPAQGEAVARILGGSIAASGGQR